MLYYFFLLKKTIWELLLSSLLKNPSFGARERKKPKMDCGLTHVARRNHGPMLFFHSKSTRCKLAEDELRSFDLTHAARRNHVSMLFFHSKSTRCKLCNSGTRPLDVVVPGACVSNRNHGDSSPRSKKPSAYRWPLSACLSLRARVRAWPCSEARATPSSIFCVVPASTRAAEIRRRKRTFRNGISSVMAVNFFV